MILGSFLGILITALVIMAPMVISDALEPIETAKEGIISYEELVTQSNNVTTWNNETNTCYVPYLEYNSTTEGTFSLSGTTTTGGRNPTMSSGTIDIDPIYNADGLKDFFSVSDFETTNEVYMFMSIDPQQMLNDNAQYLYVTIDCDADITTCYIIIRGLDSGYVNEDFNFIHDASDPPNGNIDFTYTLSTSELNDYISTGSEHWCLFAQFSCGDNSEFNGYIDMQVSPEYYEETETIVNSYNETTWNNYTGTFYEPYIQTYSNPYYWVQGLLGIGGGILFMVALISTPWVNPSEWLNLPGYRRSGGRSSLRRRGSYSRSRRRRR
jgi:hypothetical protein